MDMQSSSSATLPGNGGSPTARVLAVSSGSSIKKEERQLISNALLRQRQALRVQEEREAAQKEKVERRLLRLANRRRKVAERIHRRNVKVYLDEYYRLLLLRRAQEWAKTSDPQTATVCHLCQKKTATFVHLDEHYYLCRECFEFLRKHGLRKVEVR